MIPYPPIYESTVGARSDAEILAEMDARYSHTHGEVRHIDPELASEPPPEQHIAPTKFIHFDHLKKHPIPGFKGACGRNRKAKS